MPAKIEDLILIGKQTDFAPVWASFHACAASPQGLLRLKRKSPAYQRALPHREPSVAGTPDSHPSWRPPAMGVLSEMDGRAPCYPAFSQVAGERQGRREAF